MKHCLLIVLLLGSMSLMAQANESYLFSEYWFDNAGDMFVELSSTGDSPILNAQLRFGSLDAYMWHPQPLDIPQAPNAIFLNLSQELPGLNLNSVSGILSVSYLADNGSWEGAGYAIWEEGNSPNNGKSKVAVYENSGWWPAWEWSWDMAPTPGTNPFQPISRGTLNVTCLDQNGNPVPNAIVSPISAYSQNGVTDANGFFSTSCVCHTMVISVVYNYREWHGVSHGFYPGETTSIQVNINTDWVANDDPALPPAQIPGLKAFPNPYIQGRHDRVSLVIDGGKDVLSDADVRIYNQKGQRVAVIPVRLGEDNQWIPELDLPSGSYLLKLLMNGKNYGTQTIRILK